MLKISSGREAPRSRRDLGTTSLSCFASSDSRSAAAFSATFDPSANLKSATGASALSILTLLMALAVASPTLMFETKLPPCHIRQVALKWRR